MAAMKIQDGALVTSVTSQLRYDSSNKFILRRLISGVSFMSISSIVFEVQGRQKKAQSQSDDGFRSGCRNVSQHQQQSFSGLHY